MASFRRTDRPAAGPLLLAVLGAGAVGCVTAVAVFGELRLGSLIAVGCAGALVAGWGLARRAGSGVTTVGRPGRALVAVLVAVALWELVALADDDLPTVSDLADPLLAFPALRAAATVAWLIAGGWLVTRPARGSAAASRAGSGHGTRMLGPGVAAVMRTLPGRVTVLACWVWLGVHFLAR